MPPFTKPVVPGETAKERKGRLERVRRRNPATREAYLASNRKYYHDRIAAMSPEEEAKFRAEQVKKTQANPRNIPEYRKAKNIWNTYKITIEEYEKMKDFQNGACAICKVIPQPGPNNSDGFNVDHCHITGEVRSLLCAKCNIGLGGFRDNHEWLMEAAAYLVAHETIQELNSNA